MTVRFADTNLLLYAISTDPLERRKAVLANELLRTETIGLSVQVLQEFYVQATRAGRVDPLAHEDALDLIESWTRFPVQAMTLEIVRAALATKDRFQISYWDAAILEAARALGCDVVLTEDLSVSTDYAGMRVQNPFEADRSTTAG
jgi:predicted nucleic acid-binding protein